MSQQIPQPIQLSLEQKFNIRSFETQVRKMSRQQAQEFLITLYQHMIVKDAMYKECLKQHWGIDEMGIVPQIGDTES